MSWLQTGMSGNKPSAEFSPSGKFFLIRTGNGFIQLWSSTPKLLWSSKTGTTGAIFSADDKYVLLPAANGVVRLDAATGELVDVLPATGLTKPPVAIDQYGDFVAMTTDTRAFVYRYPTMVPVASYDHKAGSATPIALTGAPADPFLVIGSDVTNGPGGARVFDADSGQIRATTTGFPLATFRSAQAPVVYGHNGRDGSSANRIYESKLMPPANREFPNSNQGPIVRVALNGGSFDYTGTYLTIPTYGQELYSPDLFLKFVDRSTGSVVTTERLNVGLRNRTGEPTVRFSPTAPAFVLIGSGYGETSSGFSGVSTVAYFYTYNPDTFELSVPRPLIGSGTTNIPDGHLPSTAIVHTLLKGVPYTIDGSREMTAVIASHRRRSDTGGDVVRSQTRPGPQTDFTGIAVSPGGTRYAIATDRYIRVYDTERGDAIGYVSEMKPPPTGVAFLSENEYYSSGARYRFSGDSWSRKTTTANLVSPVGSPAGGRVLAREASNDSRLTIHNLEGVSASKLFTVRPESYGFVGGNTVWVSYARPNGPAMEVVTEFYDLTWAPSTTQLNRVSTFPRTAGTEEAGSRVSPDGRWIASWYTGAPDLAAMGGNGNGIPVTGAMRIVSAKSGPSRETMLSMPIRDGGVSAASFTADSLRFTYSTTAGNLQAIYVPVWMEGIVAPASVVGGNPVAVAFNVTHVVGASGASIPFTVSSNLKGSSGSVTIEPGKASQTITLATNGVLEPTVETVTATFKGVTYTAKISVLPASLLTATVNPSGVVGGTSATLTVTLDGKAPPNKALIVLIKSTLAPAAVVPTSLEIPANGTTATKSITTIPVADNKLGTITCTLAAVTKTAPFTVLAPGVQAFTVTPLIIKGGSAFSGTVTLDSPAPPGGLAVLIESEHSAAVPSLTVKVPAGAKTLNFVLTSKPVLGDVSFLISAKTPASAKAVKVTIQCPRLTTFSLDKLTIVGGQDLVATVSVDGPAAAGTPIWVSFSKPIAYLPASVTFTPNARTMTFKIKTKVVTSNQTVDIQVDIGSVRRKIIGVKIQRK